MRIVVIFKQLSKSVVPSDHLANESKDELIETLWLRVEPGIKKLMPKATQIDLFRTKVMVKRALKQ